MLNQNCPLKKKTTPNSLAYPKGHGQKTASMRRFPRAKCCAAALLCLVLLCACKGPPLPPKVTPTPEFYPDDNAVVHTKSPQDTPNPDPQSHYIDAAGGTIGTRFTLPEGFVRVQAAPNSFAAFVRGLALEPHGTLPEFYDGTPKTAKDYEGVLVTTMQKRNMFQSAQAMYRLQAMYLFSQGRYAEMKVTFMNGFVFGYDRWRGGESLGVSGNSVYWKSGGTAQTSSVTLESYLDQVNTFCNATTLRGMLTATTSEHLTIGDVLYRSATPIHCMMVVDMAQNPETGERLFLFAQGGTPAQPIQIVRNVAEPTLSPWYSSKNMTSWSTPGAIFQPANFYRMSGIRG